MLVTGLANTAPLLPGNAGVYQGAAIGALALVHEAGARAVAVSVLAPVVISVATAVAAIAGLALYGRRFVELPRAAFARP
jgi:phosphate/sulfate permease